MWRFLREFWCAPLVQYPSFDETAAILGPRYQEIETPFGVIGYLGPLNLPGGDMGASVEFCDV